VALGLDAPGHQASIHLDQQLVRQRRDQVDDREPGVNQPDRAVQRDAEVARAAVTQRRRSAFELRAQRRCRDMPLSDTTGMQLREPAAASGAVRMTVCDAPTVPKHAHRP
jgi:hypothetical protein